MQERTIAQQVLAAKAIGLPHLTLPRAAVEELLARAGAADRIEKLLDGWRAGDPFPTYGDLRSALESQL